MGSEDLVDDTYSLGATSRLTGISAELLRAWERRHQVVQPLRTDGGTRRYRASDLERLSMLKRAVDQGHRIGRIAGLATTDLEALCHSTGTPQAQLPLESILDSLIRLDAVETQRQLSTHIVCLGACRFASEIAVPLLAEVGERWANDRLGIASEHLATTVLRSVLGGALQPSSYALRGPSLLFGTPAGERHELGLLMAAVVANGAGARTTYLGADLPVEELLRAVEVTGAEVVVLALSAASSSESQRAVLALRGGLPEAVSIWLGGSGSFSLDPTGGIEVIGSLDELDRRVAMLAVGGA